MTPDQREWSRTRDELADAVASLGLPKELGDAMAKNLGSPKAMRRMIAYVINIKREQHRLSMSCSGYAVTGAVTIRPNAHVIKGDIFLKNTPVQHRPDGYTEWK